MGNAGSSEIVGVGDICLETNNGSRLILREVRHVPDVRLNLLSTGKLDDEGFVNTFVNGQWKLTKGSIVLARGKKCSTLYLMQAKLCNSLVNAVESDCIGLWHKRLGHMSQKGLDCLAKKNILPGIKGTSLDACSDCLAGKQNRVSFKSSTSSRKLNVLDLVHTDLCGPFSTPSIGGARYFVTFIDDHSRKIWVYTLKSKDQVLDVFKQFQAGVERETGKKIKCIRSDNGGEYRGPFDEFCRNQGIRPQTSPPKTPQLNGVTERMNRTLVERVRCMLSHAKLPKMFWGEALSTVVHILNMTPCVPLQLDVPQRVWSGKDVSYVHLKVFGCRAFVHVPKDEQSKLDAKTKECVFLGYGLDDFGYRLYDPAAKKIFRSRDVVFFEDQTIEDIGNAIEKPKPLDANIDDLDPVSQTNFDNEFGGDAEVDHNDISDAGAPMDDEDAPSSDTSNVDISDLL